MAEKQKQRFGQLSKNFGDFGELRKQKKAPHTEVLYIWVPTPKGREYRSINNLDTPTLEKYMKQVGELFSSIAVQDAEKILDMCYTELNSRVNGVKALA